MNIKNLGETFLAQLAATGNGNGSLTYVHN